MGWNGREEYDDVSGERNGGETAFANAAAVSGSIFFLLSCLVVVDSQKHADSAVQPYCELIRSSEEKDKYSSLGYRTIFISYDVRHKLVSFSSRGEWVNSIWWFAIRPKRSKSHKPEKAVNDCGSQANHSDHEPVYVESVSFFVQSIFLFPSHRFSLLRVMQIFRSSYYLTSLR